MSTDKELNRLSRIGETRPLRVGAWVRVVQYDPAGAAPPLVFVPRGRIVRIRENWIEIQPVPESPCRLFAPHLVERLPVERAP